MLSTFWGAGRASTAASEAPTSAGESGSGEQPQQAEKPKAETADERQERVKKRWQPAISSNDEAFIAQHRAYVAEWRSLVTKPSGDSLAEILARDFTSHEAELFERADKTSSPALALLQQENSEIYRSLLLSERFRGVKLISSVDKVPFKLTMMHFGLPIEPHDFVNRGGPAKAKKGGADDEDEAGQETLGDKQRPLQWLDKYKTPTRGTEATRIPNAKFADIYPPPTKLMHSAHYATVPGGMRSWVGFGNQATDGDGDGDDDDAGLHEDQFDKGFVGLRGEAGWRELDGIQGHDGDFQPRTFSRTSLSGAPSPRSLPGVSREKPRYTGKFPFPAVLAHPEDEFYCLVSGKAVPRLQCGVLAPQEQKDLIQTMSMYNESIGKQLVHICPYNGCGKVLNQADRDGTDKHLQPHSSNISLPSNLHTQGHQHPSTNGAAQQRGPRFQTVPGWPATWDASESSAESTVAARGATPSSGLHAETRTRRRPVSFDIDDGGVSLSPAKQSPAKQETGKAKVEEPQENRGETHSMSDMLTSFPSFPAQPMPPGAPHSLAASKAAAVKAPLGRGKEAAKAAEQTVTLAMTPESDDDGIGESLSNTRTEVGSHNASSGAARPKKGRRSRGADQDGEYIDSGDQDDDDSEMDIDSGEDGEEEVLDEAGRPIPNRGGKRRNFGPKDPTYRDKGKSGNDSSDNENLEKEVVEEPHDNLVIDLNRGVAGNPTLLTKKGPSPNLRNAPATPAATQACRSLPSPSPAPPRPATAALTRIPGPAKRGAKRKAPRTSAPGASGSTVVPADAPEARPSKRAKTASTLVPVIQVVPPPDIETGPSPSRVAALANGRKRKAPRGEGQSAEDPAAKRLRSVKAVSEIISEKTSAKKPVATAAKQQQQQQQQQQQKEREQDNGSGEAATTIATNSLTLASGATTSNATGKIKGKTPAKAPTKTPSKTAAPAQAAEPTPTKTGVIRRTVKDADDMPLQRGGKEVADADTAPAEQEQEATTTTTITTTKKKPAAAAAKKKATAATTTTVVATPAKATTKKTADAAAAKGKGKETEDGAEDGY